MLCAYGLFWCSLFVLDCPNNGLFSVCTESNESMALSVVLSTEYFGIIGRLWSKIILLGGSRNLFCRNNEPSKWARFRASIKEPHVLVKTSFFVIWGALRKTSGLWFECYQICGLKVRVTVEGHCWSSGSHSYMAGWSLKFLCLYTDYFGMFWTLISESVS